MMRFMRARRGLAAVSIAATVASAGLAIALPAGAATGARSGPAASASGVGTVVITCARQAVIRPSRYVISCADANNFLAGLSWSVWGWHKTAYGHGMQWINTCRPTCAAGHFSKSTVSVVLWGTSGLSRHVLAYRWLTVIYLHHRPPHTPTTVTYGLPG